MADKLLRVTCAQTAPGEYTETKRYYTGNPAELYRDDTRATFACTPFELAVGAEVDRYCQNGLPSDARQALYVVRYVGNGLVQPDSGVFNSPECPVTQTGCDLALANPPAVINPPTSTGQPQSGYLQIRAASSSPPLQYVLLGTSNATGRDTGIFTGLAEGFYSGKVYDAAGCELDFGPFDVRTTADRFWLKYAITERYDDPTDPAVVTGFLLAGTYYDPATRAAVPVSEAQATGPVSEYSRPVTQRVDAYLLPDGVTFRQVYHDGGGGLRFDDQVTTPPTGNTGALRFVNVIKTDVDDAGTATGAVLLEATNDGAGGAITYTRVDGAAPGNTTGAFGGLAAGTHRFRAADSAGQTAEAVVVVEDRYRPRWRLLGDDAAGYAREVVVYERDYAGAVEPVCGAGPEPLTRRWAGQSDPGADLPELAGQSVTLTLLTPTPRAFEGLATGDDRRHRLDVYRGAGAARTLEFRGYVAPDLLRVNVHEAQAEVVITASDGLGGLKETFFLNHAGGDVAGSGRWPVLHTLLHCLSRCDVNLPLYAGVQVRDVLVADAQEPVRAVAADRSAYGAAPVLSDVAEGLIRPFYAVLWQARGAWWLASPLDLALPGGPAWTGYTPAGLPAPVRPAGRGVDLWALKVPGALTQARHLVWGAPGAEQATVAAAKAVQATVALQLRANNLPGGELQDWEPDGLRPRGWSEGQQERVPGEKAGTYALRMSTILSLLTAPMETRPDPDYSPITLRFAARCRADRPAQGQPARPAVVTFEVLTDGQPDPTVLSFEVPRGGADAKMQEQSTVLPAFRKGRAVRLRLRLMDTAAPVEFAYIRLAILPALVEWPAADTVTVLNPDGVLQAPAAQLVHADLPRLTMAPGQYAPAQGMDVLAWRHAFTAAADGRGTTLWRRPGVRRPAPLLESAALDRLQVRTGAQRTLAGEVLGYAGIGEFSFGQTVVTPDAPGRLLLVVACEVREFTGVASVVLRAIGAAPESPVPAKARVTTAGPVRVTPDGAVRVYV